MLLFIKLVNSQKISTDPNNPDTDGDGLLDGKEIVFKTNEFQGLVNYIPRFTYVFEMKSCPLASDYSNSGISDYEFLMHSTFTAVDKLLLIIMDLT